MNLTELLDGTTSRWPQKPAFIEGDTIVSYAELGDTIARMTAQLRAFGMIPGTRVGLCHPNSVAYVALTFALWRLQAIVVPIPTECTSEETSAIAETMQLEAVISQTPGAGSVTLAPEGYFTWLTPATLPDNHGLNIAFIRFTSGTTHERKGVVLSHETVRDRVVAANAALRIGPEDTVMWCLPMAHHFLITIVLYLSQGATIVLTRQVLARPFLETANRWRASVLYASPFHYALLARDRSDLALPSVRLAVSTTCALPEDVAEDFVRRFGLPLVQALGLIELGLVSLNSDDPRGRWNSVGRPLKPHRVRIVAPEADGVGEVAIAGPGFFDAYAAPWLPRESVLRDGWFHTGDLGWLDADGFLFLVGRKAAVINLAGRKVFPEEIETVLNRHPAVLESRVFGRRHAHLGEVVEAEVVLAQPHPEAEALRDYCREHLAPYKVPTRLHVVSRLPRTTATGKIRRETALVSHE